MLRVVVLVIALLLMLAGFLPWLYGGPILLPLLVWGAVIFLGTLLERWRYRTHARREGAGWEALDERFIDPESGTLMQVFYQPATGERRYEPVAGGDR